MIYTGIIKRILTIYSQHTGKPSAYYIKKKIYLLFFLTYTTEADKKDTAY